MTHLRALPEDLPRQRRSSEDRPVVTVVASLAPEHDHEDAAKLLDLAARSAAVELRLEFARPEPVVGQEAGVLAERDPDVELPAVLRSVSDEHVRVRVLVPGRIVLRDGERVALSRLEFDLLRFLAERPGRVFGRGQLLAAVWGGDREVTPRTVDVHVRRLRAKFGRDLPLLSTVRGVGYRLDPGQLRVEHRTS